MTKLLFRPGHEFLPDNFSACEQRLKKLKNRLTSENVVEKYDEIFKEYEQNKIIEKVPLMIFQKNLVKLIVFRIDLY